MKLRTILAALAAPLALAACAQQGGFSSLGAQLDQALGTTGGGGAAAGQPADPKLVAQIQAAYQADAQRIAAGQPAQQVSQVVATGGYIFDQRAGMVPHSGPDIATVAECEVSPLMLRTTTGTPVQTLYATRVAGVVYLSAAPASACQVPAGALSYIRPGSYPLTVNGSAYAVVQSLTVTVGPWTNGAAAQPVAQDAPPPSPPPHHHHHHAKKAEEPSASTPAPQPAGDAGWVLPPSQ